MLEYVIGDSMGLKVYNVLTKKREEFIPQKKKQVKMYACGITVSDNAHIGHAFQAIVFDMIRRYFEFNDYRVMYVRNYTDVDDKIIAKARDLKQDPRVFAENLIYKTDEELALLDVKPPTVLARATECIDEMVTFIEKLIKKGYAYATDNGDVYFAVEKFANYGKFSNRTLDKNVAGVRKEIEAGKKSEHDFALWKNAGDDEIYWDSPWGKGRPGWHIECSAMSMKYLGETLDIHGGGEDLLFPHHENEIAQTEALTGKKFARFWIHNGLVNINGQKMSKSLGNVILLEDLLKEYNRDVIRMTLLQSNYRSDVNIVSGAFKQTEKKIYHFYQLMRKIEQVGELDNDHEMLKKIRTDFKKAMDNDFNTPVALANLINYMSEIEKMLAENQFVGLINIKEEIIKNYYVLGILQQEPILVINEIKHKYLEKNQITEKEVQEIIAKRKIAKENGDYREADDLRNQLLKKGVTLQDTKEKTNWDIEIK